MGLSNITRPEPEHHAEFVLYYEANDCPGAGYAFPCDSQGNMLPATCPEAEASREYVAANPDKYTFRGIEDRSYDYQPERYGTCACGRTVYLDNDYGHGIDCDCGRIYSSLGSELRPREQWEDYYDEDSTQPYNVEFGYVREDY